MRIYLAAPYSYKYQMQEYRAELENTGLITITSRWLDEPEKPTVKMEEVDEFVLEEYASHDYVDVKSADVMVFFTDSTKSIVRAGRHVEFGMALAWDKPIYVLGDRENIFHHLPSVEHFPNWDVLKEALIKDAADFD